ncbi:MAG: thioredoxin, partial [Sedimentisphaerales bacterium]|nr:thioredoxin [Sedimentisphaerales bacterium]
LAFTDDNFEAEVINSNVPVLVDFWAPWCGPCRMLGPVIDELATANAGKVKIGKVNTDDNREISLRFGISSIPTIMIFKGGQLVKQFVGMTSKNDLQSALDSAM